MELQTKNTVIMTFLYTYVVTFSGNFYFFVQFPVTFLVSFHFTLKDRLQHFFLKRLIGKNSLKFCLFANVLISPSFQKIGKIYISFSILTFLSVQCGTLSVFILLHDYYQHSSGELISSCKTETLYPLINNFPLPR